MKWLLGGFVLWIVFNGRFAQYAALVASTAATVASGSGNGVVPSTMSSIDYAYGPGTFPAAGGGAGAGK